MTSIDPRRLLILLEVEQQGSITRAAEKLNMTQPGVTKILKDFEASVGVQLLERGARGTMITAAGLAMASHAKAIASELSRAALQVDAMRDDGATRILIGAASVVASTIVPAAISLFNQLNLRTRVYVQNREFPLMIRDVQDGFLDIVIGAAPENAANPGLVCEHLCYSRIEVVARTGHPLGMKQLGLKELSQQKWLLPIREAAIRREFIEAFERRGFKSPFAQVETASYLTARALLVQSDLMALFPAELVAHELLNGTLQVLNTDLEMSWMPIVVIRRRGSAESQSVTKFVALLGEAAQAGNIGAPLCKVLRPAAQP